MIWEYALEPSLLSNWGDFRFYISQFGFDRGRLISQFPKKKWKRMVHDSLGECKDIERARIVEALQRIDDRLMPRPAISWDARLDWLENAEAEHRERPFRAIVAATNDRSHSDVIVGATLDDTVDVNTLAPLDSKRLWKAHRSKIINRKAPEMADTIDVFLKHSARIDFVDKHFGPENPRHCIPFEEFMQRLCKRPDGKMPEAVHWHCAKLSTIDFFKSECESKLAKFVPADLSVHFYRWDADDLHNRFVLTDSGGVAFLEGLDTYMGKGRSNDVVVLLDRETSEQLMTDYMPEKTKFRLIDQCEIIGSLTRNSGPLL